MIMGWNYWGPRSRSGSCHRRPYFAALGLILLTSAKQERDTLCYGMNSDAFHLWFAYPDDLLDADTAQACAALLTQEEQERCRRFKFSQHRRESMATRTLARFALSQHRAIPPGAWRFSQNEHGKPFISPPCSLRFNLSNSLGMVVCLVTDGVEAGVDVESQTRSSQMMSVAERVFSSEERAQLEVLDDAAKLDRALSLWTLKEGYIKARGMGLALPLERISFLFGGPQGIRLETDSDVDKDPGRWSFCSMDRDGHRIAIVVESQAATQMNLWQTRPLLSTPVHLGMFQRQWFPHR